MSDLKPLVKPGVQSIVDLPSPHDLVPHIPGPLQHYLDSATIGFDYPSAAFPNTWPTFDAVVTWVGSLKPNTLAITLDGANVTAQFTIDQQASRATATITTTSGPHTFAVSAQVGVWIGPASSAYLYKPCSATVPFTAQDIAFDSLQPASLTLAPGGTGQVAVHVERLGGFAGDIYIRSQSAQNLPPSVSYAADLLLQPPYTGGTLTLCAEPAAPEGQATVGIVARAYLPCARRGSGFQYAMQSRSRSLDLHVALPPGFSLQGRQATYALHLGSGLHVQFDVFRSGGFTGRVDIAISGALPPGVTAQVHQDPVTAGRSLPSVELFADATAAQGPFTLHTVGSGTVNGVVVTHESDCVVTVVPATFSVSLPSPAVELTRGGQAQVSVRIERAGGYQGSYDSLTCFLNIARESSSEYGNVTPCPPATHWIYTVPTPPPATVNYCIAALASAHLGHIAMQVTVVGLISGSPDDERHWATLDVNIVDPQAPADPTPANGTALVQLQKQPTQAWYIYSGTAADPLAVYPTKHALISKVRVSAGISCSLSHVDRFGQVRDVFGVTGSADVHAFDGMEVEGSWTAQFSGSQTSAPIQIGLTITWRRP